MTNRLHTDYRRYASMGVGAVFVVVSFQWLSMVQHWLGDLGELAPLVLLAMFVVVV
jgi:hypothetical protein